MTAALRYAKALYALDSGASVTASVQALASALKDASFAGSLANPRLTPAQRRQLATAMAAAVKAPKALQGTLGVLAANNRMGMVPQVMENYLRLSDTAAGIAHVTVQTAAPLAEGQKAALRKEIQAYTKASDVRLNEVHDAALRGGFRAFFGGMVWDASLSGKLSRLSARLHATLVQHHIV